MVFPGVGPDPMIAVRELGMPHSTLLVWLKNARWAAKS